MRAAITYSTGLYHAIVGNGLNNNVYQMTLCGVFIKPSENRLEWPWCKACEAEVREHRLARRPMSYGGTTIIKVIDSKYHLPQHELGQGDFARGQWNTTACGKSVQFGKQLRTAPVCGECASSLKLNTKRSGKLRDKLIAAKTVDGKRRKRAMEHIPEQVFTPSAATLALIEHEERL